MLRFLVFTVLFGCSHASTDAEMAKACGDACAPHGVRTFTASSFCRPASCVCRDDW